jgi:hypothetical protein
MHQLVAGETDEAFFHGFTGDLLIVVRNIRAQERPFAGAPAP